MIVAAVVALVCHYFEDTMDTAVVFTMALRILLLILVWKTTSMCILVVDVLITLDIRISLSLVFLRVKMCLKDSVFFTFRSTKLFIRSVDSR